MMARQRRERLTSPELLTIWSVLNDRASELEKTAAGVGSNRAMQEIASHLSELARGYRELAVKVRRVWRGQLLDRDAGEGT
jgi:hypothetical protein